MPGQPLPTLPIAEIAKHNTSKSCYVTHGTKVYDVTDFLSDHPGGADLILEHIRDEGHDVEEKMQDEVSHAHTEAAYEILEEHLIGYIAKEEIVNSVVKSSEPEEILPLPSTAEGKVELTRVNGAANGYTNGSANGEVKKLLYEATGMSSEEDLNKETDHNDDFKTHHFLDLNKPLLMQVWFGGFDKEFYLRQVHRPRHYKGGASAPLFGNFLEPLSLTPWWVVPTVWLPCISYGSYLASQGLPLWQQVPYFILGSCIWTIVEYVLHRFLFHLDYYLPNNRVGITLHFLLHGVHHYLPMDKYRLVMPPALFLILATPFWYLAHSIFCYSWHAATAVYCGGIFGYVCYDLTHYFLHHRTLPAYWRELKKYHLQHHFADFQNGFGVTSKFWDRVFGTEIVDGPPRPKVLKTT